MLRGNLRRIAEIATLTSELLEEDQSETGKSYLPLPLD